MSTASEPTPPATPPNVVTLQHSGPTLPDGRSIAPCENAPANMSCIPGGRFVRGTNDGPENARPQLEVFAPRGARAQVKQVVAVDGSYEDFPKREDVRFETPAALGGLEGVMLVRSKDGTTVVLNDAMFNMDKKRDFLGYLFTTLLGSAEDLLGYTVDSTTSSLTGDADALI